MDLLRTFCGTSRTIQWTSSGISASSNLKLAMRSSNWTISRDKKEGSKFSEHQGSDSSQQQTLSAGIGTFNLPLPEVSTGSQETLPIGTSARSDKSMRLFGKLK